MKALTAGCCLLSTVIMLAETISMLKQISPHLDQQWEDFKKVYRKTYTGDLEVVRRLVWESNVRYIQEHNIEYDLGRSSFRLGLNEFSDLTAKEFRCSPEDLNLQKRRDSAKGSASHFLPPMNTGPLPLSVDWRNEGYVTPVKRQGDCASGWAFSATGSLEGQMFRKTGKLANLSSQQLIDCSRNGGNWGCTGGSANHAFDYIRDNKGLDTEESYPYEAEDGACHFNNETVGATVTGYIQVLPCENETVLAQAVATVGPISIGIDCSSKEFEFYKSGIYSQQGCDTVFFLKHMVLLVGYGVEDGTKFWIVKNSWGSSWGEEGYIRIQRDAGNICCVASVAYYPLV